MADYFIGDVQGCHDELMALLALIHFGDADRLFFTGDIVNRGKQSLEVVRFIKNLGARAVTVLGNHDLHYLAVYAGIQQQGKQDNLHALLDAADHQDLFNWMRTRPLVYLDREKQFLLLHAGVLPAWDLKQLMHFTREVEHELRGPHYRNLLGQLYGDMPSQWSDTLGKYDKYRFVINCLTRMRHITSEGVLDFTSKGDISSAVSGYLPWFFFPLNIVKDEPDIKIFFGHWSALEGKTGFSNIIGLDTGCCWGNCLTAIRLSDLKYFNVKCDKYRGARDDESC